MEKEERGKKELQLNKEALQRHKSNLERPQKLAVFKAALKERS